MMERVAAMMMMVGALSCGDAGSNDNADDNNGAPNSSTPNASANGTPNGSNSATPTVADCLTACVDKASDCGAPAAQAQQACSDEICVAAPTADQISCLSGTDCQTLTSAFQNQMGVCGLGEPGSTNSSSTNSSSTNSGTPMCVELGDTGCNALNNPSNCCFETATCFGNGNQAGETICCVPPNAACENDEDCCSSDHPTLPYSCRGGTCQSL